MERSSGRARKATQKIVESRGAFNAEEMVVAARRKAKSKDHALHEAPPTKQPRAVVYQIPEPPPALPADHFIPSSVALSLLDKAKQISVSADQMTCTGAAGGFRMIRATHGVHFGPYYWECEILPSPSAPPSTSPPTSQDREDPLSLLPHVRVGWSTRFGQLNGPVGYDKHSYGYRDLGGSKVHQRMRDDDYGEAYGVGDVIGCLLDLGPNETFSQMRFFKNGKDQGQAYGYEQGTLIPKGVYFPAISLFGEARVRVNFGPSFIEPIDSTQFKYNSYCDVQPMNAREIAEHDRKISLIRQKRAEASLSAETTES